MIKFMSNLFLSFFTVLFLNFQTVLAADIDLNAGLEIFQANCVACHANGENLVVSTKTLKLGALEDNEMNSIGAITDQVTYGKNSMPAFGGRLSEVDVQNVANYVLNQATNDSW
uniref:Cytochrome c-553 n=1 Tax=Osmundaria fimbriata TaxID=228265 RepID=A0A1Z1M4G9_OSMFI|nr:cytochrome c553 [Osmundaria fimbriata]ARW60733.1 cytochrome c553 [Osmundaria fimbriata]